MLAIFNELLKTSIGNQIELHFYGYTTQVEEAFLPYQDQIGKSIFIHGTVAREVATEAIMKADVLVNIGNTTTYQLPSKVVDYVSTGKRILNIALIEDDSSAIFFNDYPLAITLSRTLAHNEATQQLYNFLTTTPTNVSLEWLNVYLHDYLPTQIATQYLGLISHNTQKDEA